MINRIDGSNYHSVDDVLNEKIKAPNALDYKRISYRGITVDVYGILHALTGGTNRDYVSFVNNTIENSVGTRYSEKEMKMIYKGIDHEVDDWLQLPLRDAFFMSFTLTFISTRMMTVFLSAIKEKITKKDKFLSNASIEHIGGSPYFHLIDPDERRLMAGFPNAPKYLEVNLERRSGFKYGSPKFPDKDWKWLEYIEPFGNIPCRSIHMIEFAVEHAKQIGQEHVSLFVGEIHNSDIDWYIQNQESVNSSYKEVPEIVKKARDHAVEVAKNNVALSTRLYHLKIRSMFVIGALIPIFIYIELFKSIMLML